jgi:hypothetical protein
MHVDLQIEAAAENVLAEETFRTRFSQSLLEDLCAFGKLSADI